MTPDLPPVLPGFSAPIYGELSVKAKDREEYKDVAGADPGDPEWTVGFYGHNSDFWHSLRLGSAIARANGIGGEPHLVKLAREIATVAHAGQFRRDGVTPYIEHPKAVAEALTGESDEVIAVAWLHDVLEDCSLDGGDLINKGLPYEVVRAVEDLTKLSVMSYETYIYQIGKNPVAKKVKIADILHNLSDSPTLNQIEKYTRALGVLGVVKEPTSDPCESVVKESLTTESPKPDAPEYHGGFMSPERAQKLESDLAAARSTITSLRAALEDMEKKANRNLQIRDSLVKLFKDDGWQDDCTLINQLTNMNFDITPHQT